MKIRLFLCFFFLCSALELVAQTSADSLIIVNTQWTITSVREGIVCKEAEIPMLYGVPQHITILEIAPQKYSFDILIHTPQAETSVAARASQAIAAINGSYFNMRKGTSVCYLRKEGIVVDTTASGGLNSVTTGAIEISQGKMKLIPWNKQIAQNCKKKKGAILASGPLMLCGGKLCDLSGCNENFIETRHPRSAVCLTRDGKVLLVAIDGRFAAKAEGIRIRELAHLLRVLGGEDALNLDGGGSTTLWSASAPGNGVLNKLCGNQVYDNQGERIVANSLCVYQ